jgi:hypothetical protein
VFVRHAVEGLRLSAATPATFYYTIDGSRPTMGAATTQMAMGQTVLIPMPLDPVSPPGECKSVQWFADYGGLLGQERAVHVGTFCFRPVEMGPDLAYETLDNLRLIVGTEDRGAIAVAPPGGAVTLEFRFRRALSTVMMNPPPFARIARVYVDAPMVTTPTFCDMYTNTSQLAPLLQTLRLTAPMAPGRYPIRLAVADNPAGGDCANLNNLGVQRTLAYLIVR